LEDEKFKRQLIKDMLEPETDSEVLGMTKDGSDHHDEKRNMSDQGGVEFKEYDIAKPRYLNNGQKVAEDIDRFLV
jgi:hypothetical protein